MISKVIKQYILYDPKLSKEDVWDRIKSNKDFSIQLTNDPITFVPSKNVAKQGVLVRLLTLHKTDLKNMA